MFWLLGIVHTPSASFDGSILLCAGSCLNFGGFRVGYGYAAVGLPVMKWIEIILSSAYGSQFFSSSIKLFIRPTYIL